MRSSFEPDRKNGVNGHKNPIHENLRNMRVAKKGSKRVTMEEQGRRSLSIEGGEAGTPGMEPARPGTSREALKILGEEMAEADSE